MPILPLDKRFHPDFINLKTKPVGQVQIDWINPLTRGLVQYYPLNERAGKSTRELVQHANALLDSNGTRDWTPNGYVATGVGSDNSFKNSTFKGFGSNSITLSGIINVPSYNSFGWLFSIGDQGTNPIVEIEVAGNGAFSGRIEGSAGSQTTLNTDGFALALDIDFHVAVVFDRDTNIATRYVNGIPYGTTNSISNVVGTIDTLAGGGVGTVDLFALSSGVVNGFIGECKALYAHNRALSSKEIKSLAENPYQILKPVIPMIFSIAEDLDGSDTTPDTFSFTDVAGKPISTPIESNIVTITGIDASTVISVNTGEYRIDGGTYTSSSGTILANQTVQLRQTSSGSNETLTSQILTIGGVTDQWDVITETALGSFIIPDAVHLMQTDWDLDARARGGFAGSGEAQPATRNTKALGSLPVTDPNATGFVNTLGSNPTGALRGVYWEFLASGGYDVSVNTKVLVWNWQFNAPNRVQCATAANNGVVLRLGSGSGSPPTNYRTWQIAGNDKIGGQARENPKMIVVDLNVVDHNALIGTFDNTDVQTVGFGTVRFNLSGGSTTQHFHQRLFIFDTTIGSSDIPRFIGASNWNDTVTAMGTAFDTKITDEWIKREGSIFSYAAPLQFGDGSTATNFNDAGATIFYPDSNDPDDPRVHVTDQAFRVHLNLRNNASDTATFSGSYDCGNSYPLWNLNQDNASSLIFNSAIFKRTGRFDVGATALGAATFDDCGIVYLNSSDANLDGSIFRNPHGDHLMRLAV